jgi:MFS family permease
MACDHDWTFCRIRRRSLWVSSLNIPQVSWLIDSVMIPVPSQVCERLWRTIKQYNLTSIGIIAMPFWLKHYTDNGVLPANQSSLIVSILSAGTFFGALLAAPLADIFGRRIGLMFATGVIFCLGGCTPSNFQLILEDRI